MCLATWGRSPTRSASSPSSTRCLDASDDASFFSGQRSSPDAISGPPVRRPMSSWVCSRLTVKPSGQGPGSCGGRISRMENLCRGAGVPADAGDTSPRANTSVSASCPPLASANPLPARRTHGYGRCPSLSWTTRAGGGGPNREGGSRESPRPRRTLSAIPAQGARREDGGRGPNTCPVPPHRGRAGLEQHSCAQPQKVLLTTHNSGTGHPALRITKPDRRVRE